MTKRMVKERSNRTLPFLEPRYRLPSGLLLGQSSQQLAKQKMNIDPTQIALPVSLLLCSLVAGLVFCFAIVVMPGIKVMDDRNFLNAFKAMDRVIQNNPPVFILVWLGSAAAVIVLALLSIWQLENFDRALALASAATYLLGVQVPTIAINIPLNNQLQSQDLDSMTPAELQQARQHFEDRWIRWNTIRTMMAVLTTVGLIVLALRL